VIAPVLLSSEPERHPLMEGRMAAELVTAAACRNFLLVKSFFILQCVNKYEVPDIINCGIQMYENNSLINHCFWYISVIFRSI
jgi:hypothetical protein